MEDRLVPRYDHPLTDRTPDRTPFEGTAARPPLDRRTDLERAVIGSIHDKPAPQFRRGDFVRLKSGGPTMLVRGNNGAETQVMWVDSTGQLHRDEIGQDLLEHDVG